MTARSEHRINALIETNLALFVGSLLLAWRFVVVVALQ